MISKNMLKITIAALLTLGFGASNAMAASDTGTAEATVVKQITISKTQDLGFGGMLQSGTGGTITISPADGTVTPSGVQTTGATATRGEFFVDGDPNRAYTTTLDPTVTLFGGFGASPMTADLTQDSNGALILFGSDVIFIGGTLNVGVNQSPGAYTGSFNVTVDY
ncbi:MAG: DUF4402 domain-containing protein [Nitrospina sp.]|jgi:hypothetical protein|nr:DUF4402 domain-containing protein [Nitrospina sp.]MBT6716605.1 DUF4402 domain-containing protein [Nitrospina sp.]